MGDLDPKNLSLPEDITTLAVEDLNKYVETAKRRFTELLASTTQELSAQVNEASEMERLANDVERVEAEKIRRTEAAANVAAKREKAKKAMDKFSTETTSTEGDDAGSDDSQSNDGEDDEVEEPTTASARPKGGATTRPRTENAKFRNPSLADAQRNAPSVNTPRQEPVLIASADIPGFPIGQKLGGMNDLVSAMNSRAKSLPVTSVGDSAPRVPVASLQRQFRHVLHRDSPLAELNEVLTAAANPEILIAAGGWCSPSEISYDFFNIVAEDGALDLPTIGINRGGIRWPISPSFADVVLGGALWSWTETQDIAAVTGTAQSGVKTCGRVPCTTFDEERLHCDGLCLTVGNLTEDAYPELIANHTRLLFASHFHKMNRARIDALRAFSAGFTVTNGDAGSGVVAPVLGALELQAIDYRDRYSMAEGALLEIVGPRWLRGAMRSDLRKRQGSGTDTLSATDATLMGLFDAIGVRIQWVNDYQVRTTGFPGVPTVLPTAWPSTVEFLMYAPGTVVLGQGLRLDLGVVRDSVLNETNDHTAQWMEECWLMFQPGHEVRRVTVNICPDGTTGAADLTACGV